MYNFNLLGHSMSYQVKVLKHIRAEDEQRVKDYVLAAYDNNPPTKLESHPCWDVIQEGIRFLKERGWKFGLAEWKNIGKQLIAFSPDGNFFHSKFNHH